MANVICSYPKANIIISKLKQKQNKLTICPNTTRPSVPGRFCHPRSKHTRRNKKAVAPARARHKRANECQQLRCRATKTGTPGPSTPTERTQFSRCHWVLLLLLTRPARTSRAQTHTQTRAHKAKYSSVHTPWLTAAPGLLLSYSHTLCLIHRIHPPSLPTVVVLCRFSTERLEIAHLPHRSPTTFTLLLFARATTLC